MVKEDKILLDILQKTVNNITNELHREIFTKWVPIKYDKSIDYALVWKIAISAIIAIILIGYWNTKIIKANRLLKQARNDIEEKNKELETLVITDKLTNLYNRRKLDELLQTEIHRSERFEHTFGIAILDIDHFKKVNDEYGHLIGDKVLIEISNILKKYLRKTDYVGRFGGEEFIIICPESKKEGIVKLMEDFRLHIENHHLKK